MEERVTCQCGSIVSRQNLSYHLTTEKHKKYIDTGKTFSERRIESSVKCECGMNVTTCGLIRHQKSKLHIKFIKNYKTSIDNNDIADNILW